MGNRGGAVWMKFLLITLAGAAFAGCAKRGGPQAEATPTPEVVMAEPQPEVVMAQPEAAPPPAAPAPAPVIVPTAVPTPVPTAIPAPKPKPHYVVKPGDSLWSISGESGVFGDEFRWPLLFKSNRDQITDPDLIYPAQDLSYENYYPKTEVVDAVDKAKETPPYQPHAKPRRQLPVKY